MIDNWLAIAAGGALGALARASLHRLMTGVVFGPSRSSHPLTPALATMLANALGCLLLGIWLAGFPWDGFEHPPWVHPMMMMGLCGGLTTFSTLCADAARLKREIGLTGSLAYLGLTLASGILSFSVGAGWSR